MAINILVVEDESIVRKDIERSLTKLGYNVVAQADTGEKAIQMAREFHPDLALMDIMLKGDLTGIDAAEAIKSTNNIPVIFLTAYADEATLNRAKVTEPHGYILKPFKEIDLHTTIEMALHKYKKEQEIRVENELLRSLTNYKSNADYLFIKYHSRLIKLNTSDIYYVEALKDYVQIITSDQKYTIHATMKDVEKNLPRKVFQRVHRSFIVNMDKIEAITGGNVVIDLREKDTKKEIPVGGNYREELGDRINVL
ncbi:MAG: response regulator [Crocinitomicaceae bacterium]|nr:response regulator [Crocinitomicaceae bacterium]